MKPYRIKINYLHIVLVLVSLIIGFVIVETFLRIIELDEGWKKASQIKVLRNVDHKYDLDGLYETDKTIINYVRDEYALRDRCDPSDIRILTIGGSTTDQVYVNIENTYQSVLEDKISQAVGKRICVSNAGVDGHSTYGHMYAFENWFPLIPNLKPTYVLLYIGINDANFNRINTHAIGYDVKKPSWKIKDIFKKLYIVQKLSPIYQYYFKRNNTKIAYGGHKPKSYTTQDYTASELHSQTKSLSAKNALAFQKRLSIILKHIKTMGALPICVTQPHIFVKNINNRKLGVPSVFNKEFSGLDYDYSLKSLNKVMHTLCGERIIDIHSEPPIASNYYDGVHTTGEGSRFLGNRLFYHMQKMGLLKVFQ